MKEIKKASFVKRPRVFEDLTAPDIPKRSKAYRVIKTIILDSIDYENFVTDMLADRQFIEDFAPLCSQKDIWLCLLVRRRGAHIGVLVMPERECYVGYAACWVDEVTAESESGER